MNRKALSKRTRFEVFKRDLFACVYCGRTPTDGVVLHVDHVQPVSGGGSDELSNLVTACDSCNLGKAGIPLDRCEAPKDHVRDEDRAAQIKASLAAQREAAAVRLAVVGELGSYWTSRLGCEPSDYMRGRFPELIDEWSLARLMDAVDITAGAGVTSMHLPTAQRRQAQYFHAVLRNWRGKGRA